MDSGSASSGGTSEAAKPEAAATTATSPHPGCGCAASASASSSSSSSSLTVRVTPTTGGQFDLQASKTDTVETLKKLISKKLKVPKERICLLHRDRQLREGTLQENQLVDGSRLTLLPSVETGLLAQRPEQSVMQALESLNDSQVNDFLSGKAPLNLTMRLGDHMMLIQLQLSTVTPSGGRRSGASPSTSGASSTSRVAAPAATTSSAAPAPAASRHTHSHAPATSSAAASKPSPSPSSSAAAAPEICRCDSSSSASGPASAAAAAARPTLDTRALAEASRNLTQTLKQLSSEDNARARRQGAIIESMHHHGKGVYSGTFSGTLNPALQDRFGRPKRDISTIIHILNDLLCATPQYRRHASRTQQQQQQQQQQPQQQQQQHNHHHHHHHHHHQQQHQHHHQQHQQHAVGSHASTSAAVASSTAVAAAAAGAGASAVPGKLITAANKVPHVAAIQSLSDESANLSRENQATRGKMEHLRLIMEERRARRRARREARAAPYTTQWSAKSEQLAPQSGVEPMDTTNSAEQSAPSTTTADVGPPEPVVA